MPTFLSVDRFPFRNSEVSPNGWGVMLDGEPIAKWETADSVRGYVDLWARHAITQIVYRHRMFGIVEFVKL